MRVKTCKCPSCGQKLSAVTRIGNVKGRPNGGALSVCASCGALLRFSRNLRVRLLTAEEIGKLPNKLRMLLEKAQRGIQQLRSRRLVFPQVLNDGNEG